MILFLVNPFKCQSFFMTFAFFKLSASVIDIRCLPGAWVAGFLGVVLGPSGPGPDELFYVEYADIDT